MLACSGACSHTLVFGYHPVNGIALFNFQLHACQQMLSFNADETTVYCWNAALPLGFMLCSAGSQWG